MIQKNNEDRNPFLEIKKMIDEFIPNANSIDDIYCLEAVKEAYSAIVSGNFGVGAILVSKKDGIIIKRAHNSVFTPFFKSDMHAEMKILSEYENQVKGNSGEIYRDLILYTSLEPCPMCLARIINSGIKTVYYASEDKIGGMVTKKEFFPDIWQQLLKGKIIQKADCSPFLTKIAWEIFCSNQSNLNNKINLN